MSKKKGLIIAAVVGIAALIYFFGINGTTGIEVKSMEVSKGSLEQTLDITGKVISDDIQEIVVPAGTELLEVMVEEGSKVEKGQVMALLDTSDLETRVAKLRIDLEQVEADLKTSGGSADRQILQNGLQKANETLTNAQRDYETTKAKLEDMRVLYENGAISKAEFDNQETALKDIESSVKTAALNVEDARLRYSDFGSTTSSTTGSLDRQKRSLILDIQQLEEQIEDSRLVADLDGTVVSSELKANRTVSAPASIVVQDTERFQFEAFVTQEDAVNIQRGQTASIQVIGLSGSYQGQVSDMGSKAETDPTSGSSTPKVKVTVELQKVDDRLVSGYDADAVITTGSVGDVLLIRNEAIKEDGENGPYVFTIEGTKAVKKLIQKGITDNFMTQVTEGISQGEKVILNPPQELEDGSDVTILE